MDSNIFNKWNTKKQEVSLKNKFMNVKERDIVFVNLGINIGIEQNGKGEEFLRPVIVYKKFNRSQFLALPLTSSQKTGRYYFKFSYIKNKNSYVILSQIRVLDTKRVKYKSGVISKNDFGNLYARVQEIFTPTDAGESRRNI